MSVLDSFAAEVGPAGAGPVVAVGGRTRWDVGGAPRAATREVRAPTGVVDHEPAEMTVRVLAGTPVDELQAALAASGQRVLLPSWPGATVGGVLAVGASGVERLGWGPLRNVALEIRYASADGDTVTAGGPTVKNVSGYDLPRLLVGSLGTLGLFAESILRTAPLPLAVQWFASRDVDPFGLRDLLHDPVAILWDGGCTWVLFEGHPRDVEAQALAAGLAGTEVGGPPELPPHRWSVCPGELRTIDPRPGPFVAELGVGVVHRDDPQPARPLDPPLAALNARVKAAFDPTGRLGPGRELR
ncbi:MAG: FAD-binding protein [Acidimicrobiales bacterium]